MPKITIHGGPSNYEEKPESLPETKESSKEEEWEVGEESSPGISSSISSGKQEKTTVSKKAVSQKPARTTERH